MNQHHRPWIILHAGVVAFALAGLFLILTTQISPTDAAGLAFQPPARISAAAIGAKYEYSFCRPKPAKGYFCGQVLEANPATAVPNGGKPPYTFKAGVGLPFGLAMNLNGVITGTPNDKNKPGLKRFQVCATDLFNIKRCGQTSMMIQRKPFIVKIKRAGTGNGTFVYNPKAPYQVCNPTCRPAWLVGTRVKITAKPNTNSTFSGWGGDCTGKGTCTLVFNKDHNVTATFTIKPTTPINTNSNTNTNTTVARYDAVLAFSGDLTSQYNGSTSTAHVDATMTLSEDGKVTGTVSYNCVDPLSTDQQSDAVVGASFTSSGSIYKNTGGIQIRFSKPQRTGFTAGYTSIRCTTLPDHLNLIEYTMEDVFSTVWGNTARLTSSSALVSVDGEVVSVTRTFAPSNIMSFTYSGTLTVNKLQ